MKRFGYVVLVVCAALAALGAARPLVGQETGTLVFDVKNYTSDTKIPKKAQKTLEHGGVRWGMNENSLVISFVKENFVKANLPNLTRFGEQKALDLKAGEYTITCVGYEFNSTSTDPEKSLAKGGFFNNDVVTFTVLPGKTTTLELSPVYREESQHVLLAKLSLYLPDLKVGVLEDGVAKGEAVVVNRRTATSVAWNDYHGPLKF